MRQINPEYIAQRLTDHYGLPLIGVVDSDGGGHEYLELCPDSIRSSDSFSIKLSLGWRSISGEFIPGAYATTMIQEMGSASSVNKALFTKIIQRLLDEKGDVEMQINGLNVEANNPKEWPREWQRLKIAFKKSPIAVNTEEPQETEQVILRWGGLFLAGILALIPLEETEITDDTNPEGLPEGAKTTVVVNRYERNRFNRAACIDIHGDSCKVCGFNFGDIYGELGRGFIHVHHITPVSMLGENYQVNPATDLVPLCPNCHAMIHQHNPPLDTQELIRIIQESTTSK